MDKVEEILEAYKRLPAPDQYKVAENVFNMEEESKNGFDTNNMRSDLEEVCHNRETCDFCPVKDKFGMVDCDFDEMKDERIIEIYDKILGCNRVEKKFYTSKEKASFHIEAGARKVVVPTPTGIIFNEQMELKS